MLGVRLDAVSSVANDQYPENLALVALGLTSGPGAAISLGYAASDLYGADAIGGAINALVEGQSALNNSMNFQ